MKFSVYDYSAGCASTFLTLEYGLLWSAIFLLVYFVLKFVVNRPLSKRERVDQLAQGMAKRQRERRAGKSHGN
jgi:HAMP domain-containing protein